MKCPNCGLENPQSALRCDCGQTFGRESIPPQIQMAEIRKAVASSDGSPRAIWVLPLLGALIGGAELAANWSSADSAPKEAALERLALACAVIPYCLARALAGLLRKGN